MLKVVKNLKDKLVEWMFSLSIATVFYMEVALLFLILLFLMIPLFWPLLFVVSPLFTCIGLFGIFLFILLTIYG